MSLELRAVTLTYPDGARRLRALDDVSLVVPGGTMTAVVGPSGSGKSSLLAVAATLVAPESGQVLVGGVPVQALSPGRAAALRRERIGIVFQQPHLLPALTAVEQLRVMGHLGRGTPPVARERAIALLDRVGMGGHADRRPHELSGGQRQRVAIARALVHDPDVLLVDEPTSALDRERGAAVVALLRTLTDEGGTATVLVTHDREHLHVADRVVAVVDGRVREPAPA